MMLNMIQMNRINFFLYILFLTSSNGLRGKLILGKLYTQSSLVNTTLLQFIYTHTLLIVGQIVRLYRKALRGHIIKRVWVYVSAAQLYVILMTGCIIYTSISLLGKPQELAKMKKVAVFTVHLNHI